MQREISFYSDRYGKHVSGIWSVFGGRYGNSTRLWAATNDPRRTAHRKTLARLMLIEIEGQRRRS